MSRFMDICRLIQENEPPIKMLTFRSIMLNSCYQSIKLWIVYDQQNQTSISCNLNSSSMWRCFGQAVQKNKTLHTLELRLEPLEGDASVIEPEAEQSIKELYIGLIKNKSIKILHLEFPHSNQVPAFDLDRFIRYKKGLSELHIISSKLLFPIHGRKIETAVKKNSVVTLDLRGCEFDEDCWYEMISACTQVQRLQLKSDRVSSVVFLATITERHTLCSVEIESLCVQDARLMKRILKQVVCDSCFIDPSNMGKICNSNHTLKRIVLTFSGKIVKVPAVAKSKFLELNRYNKKSTVIQKKIAHYYLRGDFDVSPFTNMNVWLLPKVMTLIDSDDDGHQNAIYRLLKNIPELCNLRGRNVGQLLHDTEVRQTRRAKRRRVATR